MEQIILQRTLSLLKVIYVFINLFHADCTKLNINLTVLWRMEIFVKYRTFIIVTHKK
jgi:hypothetical protein